MGRMPDLTGLVYFAIFGMACASTLSVVGGGWLLYHLTMALIAYIGA